MPKSYEAAFIDKKEPKSYEKAFISPAGNKFGEAMPPGSLDHVIEDFGAGAFKGMTADLGDDAVGLVDEDLANTIREGQETAKERSPVASFAGETLGEQVNPITKAGSLRKNVLNTIAKIYGSSKDKTSKETAMAAGMGAAADVALDVGLKAIKIPFANSSKTLRARVAGASTTEFKDVGINSREKIAEKAHAMNFFKSRPMEFDLDQLKWVPTKKEANIILQKPTSEVLQERARSATDKMKKEYDFIIGVADKSNIQIPAENLARAIEETFDKYSKGARGRKRLEELQPHLDDLYEDVLNLVPTHVPPGKGLPPLPTPESITGNVSLKKLAEWKGFLQDEATYGKDSLIKDIPYIEDFYSDLAFKVNQIIQANVPGQTKKLQDLGMGMHDMLMIQRDLKHKIARQKATGLVNPPSLLQGRQGSYAAQKLMESIPMGSTDEGLLNRANVQDLGAKVKDMAPELVDTLRQSMESIPRELGRAFNPKPSDPGREPQSVNLPELLLKSKIPRTSEEILANKKVVLAKVAQQDPTGNFYNFFKELLEERPEELSAILPQLIQSTPTAFERDPYGRVDNKILDQNLKFKAINDTMRREDLTTIEKATIINNLNKTGEFLDY